MSSQICHLAEERGEVVHPSPTSGELDMEENEEANHTQQAELSRNNLLRLSGPALSQEHN